jgi:hypothetical protein
VKEAKTKGLNAPEIFIPPLSNEVKEAKSRGAKCPRDFYKKKVKCNILYGIIFFICYKTNDLKELIGWLIRGTIMKSSV